VLVGGGLFLRYLISARASVERESECITRRVLNTFTTSTCSSSASFEPAEPVA
jgi:hypothetical protein